MRKGPSAEKRVQELRFNEKCINENELLYDWHFYSFQDTDVDTDFSEFRFQELCDETLSCF